jgi:dihydrofolate reductase
LIGSWRTFGQKMPPASDLSDCYSTLIALYQTLELDAVRGTEMRKLVVLTFVTLDGVMQAPGGPKEDTSGAFKHGGWTVPYFDEFLGKVMADQMGKPFDLLLGRETYDLFASYWPKQKEEGALGINKATKYVVSRKPVKSDWKTTVSIHRNIVKEIEKLKKQDGPELQVHGSANLIQTLLKHDLVDEFWLKIFPITLGKGKRLFGEGTLPATFTLSKSMILPNGVIIANYTRGGPVKTGSFPM